MDYFELLGVEKEFDLDLATLERNYLNLQKKFHPDRHSNISKTEKIIILQKATDINSAYEVLKSPIKRAEYMLKLEGMKMGERELSRNADPEILEESIVIREGLEESKTLKEIKKLEDGVKKAIQDLTKELKSVFGQGDFIRALKILIRIKYLDKFLAEARLKKLQLGKENAA